MIKNLKLFLHSNLKQLISKPLRSITYVNQNSQPAKSESIEEIISNETSNTRNYSNYSNSAPKKRTRLSFLRDGMMLSMYFRRVKTFF